MFASYFDAADWGRIIGLWHDLGKYSDAFQAYLRTAEGPEGHIEQSPGRVDHSTAGAQHASETVPRIGRLLAYAIAGHHAGLADAAELDRRLAKEIEPWIANAAEFPVSVPILEFPPVTIDRNDAKRAAFQCALFIRMLFSCLVDADRLATEAFCDRDRSSERRAVASHRLLPLLEKYLTDLAANATVSKVNSQRQAVLVACRQAAIQSPGLFSLTVPTGGGKTLSSLAFALHHAKKHDMRRVVMAIPFTSIIEQTADQYRKVFCELGEGVLVEHHSNIDPKNDTRLNMLAAENWDAPLVVTTNVQLFESLFAARTSACRKLHRLTGSVIILDEAQTLPVQLLRPCLAVLRELVTDYGCSVVMCTATQPALDRRGDFSIGLQGVREIIPESETLYSAMRRAEIEQLGSVTDEQLVERLDDEPSWLAIVNTRQHAAELYARLVKLQQTEDGQPPADLFHLSTLMCPQHRSQRIREMIARLNGEQPCRVVSTQLIEAGVDISFPVVFRAMAGIDSIAQAAGRCNRHGELPQRGRVYLFDPADVQPRGYLGATAATARELLSDFDDLLSPAAVRRYFELHYWNQGAGQPKETRWDDAHVMQCFPEERGRFYYDFRAADERFRFIDDATHSVIIPFQAGAKLIEQLRRDGPNRGLLRRLQRYTVGLHDYPYGALLAAGDIEILESGYGVLTNNSLYSNQLGLRIDRPGFREAEAMIA